MRRTESENCSREQLLNTINEVSFAVDDIKLYLDTHPEDEEALAFYRDKVMVRNEALRKYARLYGPLTIDTANESSDCRREWVIQPWHWEVGF